MKLQKPWHWLFGFIVTLLLICLAVYFWWKSPTIKDIAWIPKNTDIILTVNTRELIEAALEAGNKSNLDSGKMNKNFRESGIDLLKPFWLFISTKNKQVCAAFELENPAITQQFLLKNLHAKQVLSSDTWQFENYFFIIKNKWLYTFLNQPSELQSVDKSALFLGNIAKLKNRFSGEWMKGVVSKHILNPYHIQIPFTSDPFISFKITNSELQLELTGLPESKGIIDKNNWAEFSIPSQWLGRIVKDKIKSEFKKQGIDSTGIFANNTFLNGIIYGLKNHKTTKVSYEYDDEFNRIEVVKENIKIVPAIALYFDTKDKSWWLGTKGESVSSSNEKNLTIFGIPISAKAVSNTKAYIGNAEKPSKSAQTNGFLYINLDSFRHNSQKFATPGLDKVPNDIKKIELSQSNGVTKFTIGCKEFENKGILIFTIADNLKKINK